MVQTESKAAPQTATAFCGLWANGTQCTELSHTHIQNIKGGNWQKKHDWEILRLSGHAPSTTKRGAQNMADSRNRRQELVEPEACAT